MGPGKSEILELIYGPGKNANTFYSVAERDTQAQPSAFLLINASSQVNGGRLASKAIMNWLLKEHVEMFRVQADFHLKKAENTMTIRRIENKIYSGMLFLA